MGRLTNDEIRNKAISIIRNLTAEENNLTHRDLVILSSFLLIERTDKDKLTHYEDLEEQGRLIEQKHGHWIYKHDEEGNTGNAQYECSECGAGDLHAKSQEVPYCWKCGAKMELKELE